MKVEEGVESGPGIGEVLPDFTLPDQWGKAVNFKAARAGKKGLVLFYRSASW
ncbi:MAG: peroxiredoxin [Candidatus Latescibacterota bacterium]|jgi:peroxiredoxin